MIYDCVGFIHTLLYTTSPFFVVQYSSLQWQGGSSVCHTLWDWSWNHKPPVSLHLSTFTFCSDLEEIFPNKSTSDEAIEMKCVRSEPDNVSGQWLHSVWLIMLCSTQNVTQRYTVLRVRQCLFWLLRAVLRSLLPRQMLIANEHIQVLQIVGQGESIVSNFQTIVTLITLGVIPRKMISVFMSVVPFDGQKVLQKLPRLHPRGV